MNRTSKVWTREGVPMGEKVWDAIVDAREAGFTVFFFEVVTPTIPIDPPFVNITAIPGTLPVEGANA